MYSLVVGLKDKSLVVVLKGKGRGKIEEILPFPSTAKKNISLAVLETLNHFYIAVVLCKSFIITYTYQYALRIHNDIDACSKNYFFDKCSPTPISCVVIDRQQPRSQKNKKNKLRLSCAKLSST